MLAARQLRSLVELEGLLNRGTNQEIIPLQAHRLQVDDVDDVVQDAQGIESRGQSRAHVGG